MLIINLDVIKQHEVKIRFLIVGAWNTIFGYLVFIGFDAIFAGLFSKRYAAYMSAAVLSNILAITNAYIFHKYVTFRSTIKGKGIIFEFIRFSTTYLFTFALSLLLLPLVVEIGNLSPKVSGAVLIVLCTGVSYVGHDKFSFHRIRR